jgi:hypothetical protein
MLVLSKPSTDLLRSRRRERGRASAMASKAAPQAARNRRQGGPSQDRALYTCGCGLAFDALVSTSVGCPHCGTTQAW